MATVFVFKPDWFIDGRSTLFAAKAHKTWVLQFVSEDELCELFGGYATWRAPAEPSPEMPGEAIGVWGRRKVARFKRILRDRGAGFNVVSDSGPKQALKEQVKRYGDAG